ncbi:MAG: prephenate dehydratase [Dehalococcoidia bacterium]
MSRRVAFLGPLGTYNDEAARRYAPDADRVPYPSLPHVGAAFEAGEVDEAVVPIENSLYGSVTDMVDFLISAGRARIRGELLLPIEHCLIARPGVSISDLRKILSHPQALGQCRGYLAATLPDAEQVATVSTAAAVADLQQGDDSAAAIAPRRAAEMYGLEILAEGIQDSSNNITRFVILGTEDHPRTGHDKTSIAFDFVRGDQPGLVYAALRPFADRGINLTKIESRPTGSELGSYMFLLDFDGHREDPLVREALEEIGRHASTLKVLGSYPRA